MRAMLLSSSFLIFLHIHLGTSELGHNEPCSKDVGAEECDFNKGLVCTDQNGNSVCRCIDENQMEYSLQNGSCVVFNNGQCIWESKEEVRARLYCSDSFAFCNSEDSACQCQRYFLPEEEDTIQPDNRCLPAVDGPYIGVSCNSSLPCHPATGMNCFKRLCRCSHPLKQVSIEMLTGVNNNTLWRKCVSTLDVVDSCEMDSDCIPNANCGVDRQCHCNKGFTVATSGELHEGVACLVDYEGMCASGNLTGCNQDAGLFCAEDTDSGGKCLCEYAPDTAYDEILQECAAPEGYPCTLHYTGGLFIPCQHRLECKSRSPGSHTNTGACVASTKL